MDEHELAALLRGWNPGDMVICTRNGPVYSCGDVGVIESCGKSYAFVEFVTQNPPPHPVEFSVRQYLIPTSALRHYYEAE